MKIIKYLICIIIVVFTLILTVSAASTISYIDSTSSNAGYFSVFYEDTFKPKMKIGIKYNNHTTYYDYIPNEQMQYSFSNGEGKYYIYLYKNVFGCKYKIIESKSVNVVLDNVLSPYLVSVYNISFYQDDLITQTAQNLCTDCKTEQEKVLTIHKYIKDNISYDYDLANSIIKNDITSYIPKAENTLVNKKGICYDTASLFAAMCRSQNIPCDIVRGYYKGVAHAWNKVYITNKWYQIDVGLPLSKSIK